MEHAKSRTRRCAIYTRKSSEEGLEQDFNSLHAQREACEAFIKSQTGEGWRLIRTAYDDGGLSGGTMERPALQRLLDDIRRRLVDVVVVYKVDRLMRSLPDFAKMVELFDARAALNCVGRGAFEEEPEQCAFAHRIFDLLHRQVDEHDHADNQHQAHEAIDVGSRNQPRNCIRETAGFAISLKNFLAYTKHGNHYRIHDSLDSDYDDSTMSRICAIARFPPVHERDHFGEDQRANRSLGECRELDDRVPLDQKLEHYRHQQERNEEK
jgi:hypothetical protein